MFQGFQEGSKEVSVGFCDLEGIQVTFNEVSGGFQRSFKSPQDVLGGSREFGTSFRKWQDTTTKQVPRMYKSGFMLMLFKTFQDLSGYFQMGFKTCQRTSRRFESDLRSFQENFKDVSGTYCGVSVKFINEPGVLRVFLRVVPGYFKRIISNV